MDSETCKEDWSSALEVISEFGSAGNYIDAQSRGPIQEKKLRRRIRRRDEKISGCVAQCETWPRLMFAM